MNNALTADDLLDLAAVKLGGSHSDGSPRYLRTSEIDDHGVRLIGAGLVEVVNGHLALTVAGVVEADERGL